MNINTLMKATDKLRLLDPKLLIISDKKWKEVSDTIRDGQPKMREALNHILLVDGLQIMKESSFHEVLDQWEGMWDERIRNSKSGFKIP